MSAVGLANRSFWKVLVPRLDGVTSPSTSSPDPALQSNDMVSCRSGIGGGLPDKADVGEGDSYATLLNGAYNPTSNVDHM